ncbi:MAG: formyltetrahydrofolate deformylase [Burkholderiales bacterium]|nr:Formyltetrahydrofolate deformylase [Rhodocyclaceae bacterium]MCQ3923530.1 formyltetrahydrofolate deformylase [Rhodocyclaceae bacterium]MCZ2419351.1 formyltetrahydrofolate deformylase [Burkholderiales bacterium]HNQ56361.1 formyltetrahydrofolate deformylase [Candidatus Desulfobacillus denitrificans]HNT64045.1 formyltetrahydrofolate deformylase [Candidatus Desulfobacillus denitrificans]
MHAQRRYTLTASCPDRVGIVARVAGFIAENRGWILETSHHADDDTQRYFMRIEIKADSLPFDLAEFRRRFAPIAAEFAMDWRIADSAEKKRLVVLVSQQEHCLYDLLSRWQSKELDVEIPCVISNHETFRGFVEWHGIPFHHVPVTAENRREANAEIGKLFEQARGDVMVLARYMQILPPELCEQYPGRIINIHHSFLPSFVGAKPYHQAYRRGVKLIGATCHFVTAELDAGPIIEQDTVRIDHGDTVEDLVRYGKDIEKAVLARGLRYHVEDRVLLNGNRTVVFR